MISSLIRPLLFLIAILAFTLCHVQVGWCEEPQKVTICQLKDNPVAHNHELIEVTGFVSHGFEDFGIFDPTCGSFPYVWLEYGGKVKSGTMYCCGVTDTRSRRSELIVENIQVPLVDDEQFKTFDNLIHVPPSSLVHATIVGRFFAGKIHYPKAARYGGYGHMGCCSLLAIQQVVSVDPHDREDADYSLSPDQPRIGEVGCGYRLLVHFLQYDDLIQAERSAEAGERNWAFDDPKRVASDALAASLKTDKLPTEEIKQTSSVQGRIVYEWIPDGKDVSYMVVVSRPYWLSFYAKDKMKIAWVVIAAYESSCTNHKAVTRHQ
jgi:hypothetical protein